ncbi:hypothetical protein ACSNOI_06320 [Actinomadura kijaniata]|uniref:bestrophin-like domain n=1 Tax=Actinomadura kijaniata TaxID=46161 RepID=UPI003F19E095
MDVIVAAVVVAAAIVIMLLVRRRRRVRSDPDEGIAIGDLVGPLETLAVLVIAFVMVLAAESYSGAEGAASNEAAAVDNMHSMAALLPDPIEEKIKGAIVCYASAVVKEEWPSMAARYEASTAPDRWTQQFRDALQDLRDPSMFRLLADADTTRATQRRERIEQSAPAVPAALYWFMVLTVVAMVAGYAISLPLRGHGPQLAGLWVLAGLLVASLYLIWDIDRPFRGLVPIDAAPMQTTQEAGMKDFLRRYGADRLPCDQKGLPRNVNVTSTN